MSLVEGEETRGGVGQACSGKARQYGTTLPAQLFLCGLSVLALFHK